jgi:hypothetical protein
MRAKVERREALWTFDRESGQTPSTLGTKGRQIPAFASKHAEIKAKLDIPSNLATILLEPTQRRRMPCGWRQTGPASQIGPRAFGEGDCNGPSALELRQVVEVALVHRAPRLVRGALAL